VQCSAVQCSAVQCSAVQCSAHSTVQCSAVQCSAVQCSAVQCSAVRTAYHQRWDRMYKSYILHLPRPLRLNALADVDSRWSTCVLSVLPHVATPLHVATGVHYNPHHVVKAISVVKCSAVQCMVQCSAWCMVQCSAVQCSAV
jgi:hypothetical protein